MNMTTHTVVEHLSVEEVSAAISEMSEADWIRLRKTSYHYNYNRLLEADDILHTAVWRALEGTRQCPRHVDVVRFLAEAMRSIASDHEKAQRRRPELYLAEMHDNEDVSMGFDIPDMESDPATALENEQEAEDILEQIYTLFKDDETAQILIQGWGEEMNPTELCDLTGLDQKGYASKRRLIRRRINKAFPGGRDQ